MEPTSGSSALVLEGDVAAKDVAGISREVLALSIFNCRSNQWKEIFEVISTTNVIALQLPANRIADSDTEALGRLNKLVELHIGTLIA